MIKEILPLRFDNTYHGRKAALWLFVPVLVMKLLIGLNSILMGEMVARSADGVPLDSFTPAGARAVVALFAIWGLAQVMMVLIGILAFFRYRSMTPLICAWFLLEHLSRKLILFHLPMVPSGLRPPGAFVNIALLSMMIIGFVLSLQRRDAVAKRI